MPFLTLTYVMLVKSGDCDNSGTYRVLTLQNIAMRLMTFNGPRTSATPLYAELGILKLFDLTKNI